MTARFGHSTQNPAAARARLDSHDFAGYALRLADMLAGLADGDAVRSEELWSRQEQNVEQGFRCVAGFHGSILGAPPVGVCDGRKKMFCPSQNGTSCKGGQSFSPRLG
jgi:hypothetical protein